ncbi:MAG: TIGR00282 family metallophosphoesterase [Pseudomonadota bacterium]
MRLLFLGDVVGRAGREAVTAYLPGIIAAWRLDAVICNGENAAGGFGITESIAQDFIDAGVDAITLGNHSFDQREALVFIDRQQRMIRPVNYPSGTPGRGSVIVRTRNGARIGVVNVMGRVFMDPLDDPFASLERVLPGLELKNATDAVVVDFHAEASSEKQAAANYCDGRVSLFVGTHTHVPTADHRILPEGTAYVTDVGMCGDYDSIIGMDKAEPMYRFKHKITSGRFEAAEGPATLTGVAVEIREDTGLAKAIYPVRFGGILEKIIPPWI